MRRAIVLLLVACSSSTRVELVPRDAGDELDAHELDAHDAGDELDAHELDAHDAGDELDAHDASGGPFPAGCDPAPAWQGWCTSVELARAGACVDARCRQVYPPDFYCCKVAP